MCEDNRKRICFRCKNELEPSPVEGYSFYCPNCDEDFCKFETLVENPYEAKNPAQEEEIDRRLIFGNSHGNLNNYFQNMYLDNLFIGRQFYRERSIFEPPDIKFVIQVPADAVKSEDHEKYGLHHNGESIDMYACLEREFPYMPEAFEFAELMLKEFPGCYGKAGDWDLI